MKLLVIIMSSTACGQPAALSKEQAMEMYWATPGHAGFIAACTYNRVTVDRGAFALTTTDVPCVVSAAHPVLETSELACTKAKGRAGVHAEAARTQRKAPCGHGPWAMGLHPLIRRYHVLGALAGGCPA